MRLADVCDIQMGYTARTKLEMVEHGGIAAVQLRDISSTGALDIDALTQFALVDVHSRYFARGGDVLFRSRGDRNTATLVDEDWPGEVVVILPLILLRPNPGLILPAFLHWAINQHPAQRYFDKCARGTSLRMISRASLDDLEVDIPPLEQQRTIIEIDALASRERLLSIRKAKKQRAVMDALLQNYAKSARSQAGFERTST